MQNKEDHIKQTWRK